MLSEVGAGLFILNVSTKLLPRIIGVGRVKQLMLLRNEIIAEEAISMGLINQICKSVSLKRILKKNANEIVQIDHLALCYTKTFINENYNLDIEFVLARESISMITTGQSKEVRKRIEKFVKK